jgi:hypothetical protein
VSDLDPREAATAFRPIKGTLPRFNPPGDGNSTLDQATTELRQKIKAESSFSRLPSTDIVLYDVNAKEKVELRDNQTSAIYISNSAIHSLTIENNKFEKLAVFRNSINILTSRRDVFYGGVYITRNEVSNSLVLDSTTFDGSLFRSRDGMQQGPSPEQIQVEVTHNRIGRDLTFAPFGFVAGAVRQIDLPANQVAGEMHVQLPTAGVEGSDGLAWEGDIWLTSLRVDGTVALELTKQMWADDANRRLAIVDDIGEIQNGFESCEHPPAGKVRISVHFDGTHATNIRWALPLIPMQPKGVNLSCVTWFTWTGKGLRYDSWESGGDWQSGNDRSDNRWIDEFRRWVDLYPDAPPDPLHQMANYLWSVGERLESLSVRSDAKHAEYPVPAGDWLATFGNLITRLIMYPNDFGLQSQRAFALLVYVVLFSLGAYRFSENRWRDEWRVAIDNRYALAKKDRLREAAHQHLMLKNVDRARQGDLEDLLNAYAQIKKESDYDKAKKSQVIYDTIKDPFKIWQGMKVIWIEVCQD